MQIGNGDFNGDHQTVVIDHKVCWLIAKNGLAAFLNPSVLLPSC